MSDPDVPSDSEHDIDLVDRNHQMRKLISVNKKKKQIEQHTEREDHIYKNIVSRGNKLKEKSFQAFCTVCSYYAQHDIVISKQHMAADII